MTAQYSFRFGGKEKYPVYRLGFPGVSNTDFSRCFPVLSESWSLFKTDFSQRKDLENCRVAGLNFGQH